MDTSSHSDHTESHQEHHHVPKPPSNTDKIMTYVSKAGIFLPACLFLVALYFYFTNQPQKVVQDYVPPVAQVQQTSTTPAKKQIAFNLNGPISCNFVTQDDPTASTSSTIRAQILNKQINVAIEEATISSRFLVKGDCLYSWYESRGEATLSGTIDPVIQAKLLEGQKACNLKPVMQTIELMSSFGMLDPASLVAAFASAGGSTAGESASQEAMMEKFSESCTEAVPPMTAFDIPQNIIFKEVEQ